MRTLSWSSFSWRSRRFAADACKGHWIAHLARVGKVLACRCRKAALTDWFQRSKWTEVARLRYTEHNTDGVKAANTP